MRMHVLWLIGYAGLIVVDVFCSNVVMRCMAIAALAIISFWAIWRVRQSWYDYGFDEGVEATLNAVAAFVPVGASHPRQIAGISQGELVQDVPEAYQQLP